MAVLTLIIPRITLAGQCRSQISNQSDEGRITPCIARICPLVSQYFVPYPQNTLCLGLCMVQDEQPNRALSLVFLFARVVMKGIRHALRSLSPAYPPCDATRNVTSCHCTVLYSTIQWSLESPICNPIIRNSSTLSCLFQFSPVESRPSNSIWPPAGLCSRH